jgi:hypothetical protein
VILGLAVLVHNGTKAISVNSPRTLNYQHGASSAATLPPAKISSADYSKISSADYAVTTLPAISRLFNAAANGRRASSER